MRPLFILLPVLIFSPALEARTWTQAASGRKIEADLVKIEGDTAHLKMKDGKVYEVKVDSLVAADQDFLKSAGEEKAATTGGMASSGGWPNFRGPNLDGVSSDTGLMKSWPDGGPDQLWVYEDAGNGYSGMSVVDGKLFTMGTRDKDCVVICLNIEDGTEIWSTRISEDDAQGYNAGWGNGPRSTPSVSDGLVYALGPKGTLACLSIEDGKKVWDKSLTGDFGGKSGGWGYAESPLIDGEKLIIGPGGNDSPVVALNKKSGKTIWEASDLEVGNGKAEYATVVPVNLNGKRQYIRLFNDKIVGLDAESGDVIWSEEWPGGESPAVIPTPIVNGNQIYISSGYGVGSKLIELDSSNKPKVVWEDKTMKNKHGGVIKFGDYVYGFSEGGGLICQSWEDGKMAWNEKGQFFGPTDSLAIADGLLFCLNQDSGTVSLAEASPKDFDLKGQFELSPQSNIRNPKGKIWTHPVVIGGKLYLKDQEIVTAYKVSE